MDQIPEKDWKNLIVVMRDNFQSKYRSHIKN